MKKLLSMILCLSALVSLLATPVLAASQFTDVKAGAYYEKSVAWAVEQGITTGYDNGTFRPDNTCTRANILTFLWRAAGAPKSSLSERYYWDVKPTDYYFEAARWAAERGITDIEGVYFSPNTLCTRAAAVEYIWCYAGRPKADEVSFKDVSGNSDTAKAIYWAVRYGVTNGRTETTFDKTGTTTRAQIVTFLYRYFVEPLTYTGPAAKPADPMKLDPLPPEDYRKHPDWYMSLTPAHEMSDERLQAEYNQIKALIDEYRARGAYITDSMLVRRDDLMYEGMKRG